MKLHDTIMHMSEDLRETTLELPVRDQVQRLIDGEIDVATLQTETGFNKDDFTSELERRGYSLDDFQIPSSPKSNEDIIAKAESQERVSLDQEIHDFAEGYMAIQSFRDGPSNFDDFLDMTSPKILPDVLAQLEQKKTERTSYMSSHDQYWLDVASRSIEGQLQRQREVGTSASDPDSKLFFATFIQLKAPFIVETLGLRYPEVAMALARKEILTRTYKVIDEIKARNKAVSKESTILAPANGKFEYNEGLVAELTTTGEKLATSTYELCDVIMRRNGNGGTNFMDHGSLNLMHEGSQLLISAIRNGDGIKVTEAIDKIISGLLTFGLNAEPSRNDTVRSLDQVDTCLEDFRIAFRQFAGVCDAIKDDNFGTIQNHLQMGNDKIFASQDYVRRLRTALNNLNNHY
jgi:hypothetical protein